MKSLSILVIINLDKTDSFFNGSQLEYYPLIFEPIYQLGYPRNTFNTKKIK